MSKNTTMAKADDTNKMVDGEEATKVVRVKSKVRMALHDGTQLEIGKECNVWEREFLRLKKAYGGKLDKILEVLPQE